MKPGFLVLESGEVFPGKWRGGSARAGEVVFNTSHSGYEEMATDPSYFSQIIVTTAPMQGNYGGHRSMWESRQLWIHGFICVEIQESERDASWLATLNDNNVPVISHMDTRALVLRLRDQGTPWGAMVQANSIDEAKVAAKILISEGKNLPKDWVNLVSCQEVRDEAGQNPRGPKVAVLDYGCKENSLRELRARSSALRIFPSRTKPADIKAWQPDGIFLSNGPGDPADVEVATETVKQLLGYKYIFGICMGTQILALALGAKTYKLKFGHRGSNHPIQDKLLNQIYVTSQNHGYAVDAQTLPSGVVVTHTNLNDGTISGINSSELKCLGVQFHPESHPGPHDAENLFDYFVKQIS